MTIIVGIVDNNKVYMGCDSAISGENSINFLSESKIISKGVNETSDNLLIGVAGTLRGLQLLKYQWNPPTHNGDTPDEKYIYVNVLNSIKDLFTEHNHGAYVDEQSMCEDNYMIGYKGRLYMIDFNYQVIQVDTPYCCIGSGDKYAYGALEIIRYADIDAKKRITGAIEVVSKFCPTVGGDVKVYEC